MRHDDIETCKEVVACESNDTFCGGKGPTKTSVERLGVGAVHFVERDECGGRGNPSGCQGEAGFGRAY